MKVDNCLTVRMKEDYVLKKGKTYLVNEEGLIFELVR